MAVVAMPAPGWGAVKDGDSSEVVSGTDQEDDRFESDCDGALSTGSDPALGGRGDGATGHYSFVDDAGEPVFDVRVTVIETDSAVLMTNHQGHASVGQESGPARTRLRWEFLRTDTGEPMEIEARIGVNDLDRANEERLIMPRTLVNGTIAVVSEEPSIREGPDAIYYAPNPDVERTSFTIEVAATTTVETILETEGDDASSVWFSFGCNDAATTMLAMTRTEFDTPSSDDRSMAPLVVATAVMAMLCGGGTVYVAKSRREARNALIDPLTGFYNSSVMDRRLRNLFANPDKGGFAILKLDVDNFRSVNMTYGSASGDVVLKAIADRAARHVRGDDDAVVRVGGDEFLLALTDLADPANDAASIAGRIMSEIVEPIQLDEATLRPSVSIGIAHCEKPCDITQIANDADQVLFVAKDHGAGQVRVHPAPTVSLESAADPGWRELPSLLSYRD